MVESFPKFEEQTLSFEGSYLLVLAQLLQSTLDTYVIDKEVSKTRVRDFLFLLPIQLTPV